MLVVRRRRAEDLAAAIAAFTGGAQVRPGKVTLDVPALVENGNAVPITVTVDSPMTADGSRRDDRALQREEPGARRRAFPFGPRAGRAAVSTRIRLAASQKLAAVARMSDGTYWSDTVDVVVTLAACVDGDTGDAAMARALIKAPAARERGEIIEIRALIAHPMETGYRLDADGQQLPRDILRRFSCRYNGELVFSAELIPAVAANPYFAF